MPARWTNDAQCSFLKNSLPDFRAAQAENRVRDFLREFGNTFFDAWPVEANDIKLRRNQIRSWFYHATRPETRKSGTANLGLLLKLLQISQGRGLQEQEVYQKLYNAKIKPVYEARLEREGAETSQERMKIRREVVAEMWEAEDEEIVSEIKTECAKINNDRKKAKESIKKLGTQDNQQNRTPEEYYHAISGFPSMIQAVMEALAEATGWVIFVSAGGPNPIDNGNICMEHHYFGPRNVENHEFPESYGNFEKGYERPLGEHMYNCFPPNVRISRALRKEDVDYLKEDEPPAENVAIKRPKTKAVSSRPVVPVPPSPSVLDDLLQFSDDNAGDGAESEEEDILPEVPVPTNTPSTLPGPAPLPTNDAMKTPSPKRGNLIVGKTTSPTIKNTTTPPSPKKDDAKKTPLPKKDDVMKVSSPKKDDAKKTPSPKKNDAKKTPSPKEDDAKTASPKNVKKPPSPKKNDTEEVPSWTDDNTRGTANTDIQEAQEDVTHCTDASKCLQGEVSLATSTESGVIASDTNGTVTETPPAPVHPGGSVANGENTQVHSSIIPQEPSELRGSNGIEVGGQARQVDNADIPETNPSTLDDVVDLGSPLSEPDEEFETIPSGCPPSPPPADYTVPGAVIDSPLANKSAPKKRSTQKPKKSTDATTATSSKARASKRLQGKRPETTLPQSGRSQRAKRGRQEDADEGLGYSLRSKKARHK